MNRRFLYALVSTVSINLVVGLSWPVLSLNVTNIVAQAQPAQAEMPLAWLNAILQEEASSIQGKNGRWQAVVGGV